MKMKKDTMLKFILMLFCLILMLFCLIMFFYLIFLIFYLSLELFWLIFMVFCLIVVLFLFNLNANLLDFDCFLFTLAVLFLLPVFLSKKTWFRRLGESFLTAVWQKYFQAAPCRGSKKSQQCRSAVSRSDRNSRVVRRSEGSRSDPECKMLWLCYGVWNSVCDCLVTCIIGELERTAKPAAGAAGGRPPQEPLQNKCCFLGKTTVVLLFWQQKQQFFVVLATKTTKKYFDQKKFEKKF